MILFYCPYTDHPYRIYSEQSPRIIPVPTTPTASASTGAKITDLNTGVTPTNTVSTSLSVSVSVKAEESSDVVKESNSSSMDTDNKGIDQTDLKHDAKNIPGNTSGNVPGRLKRPAVSLTRFLRETDKRRRIVLDEIIGSND